MKKARMNISHFRFILFNLKIFSKIVIINGNPVSPAPALSTMAKKVKKLHKGLFS